MMVESEWPCADWHTARGELAGCDACIAGGSIISVWSLSEFLVCTNKNGLAGLVIVVLGLLISANAKMGGGYHELSMALALRGFLEGPRPVFLSC